MVRGVLVIFENGLWAKTVADTGRIAVAVRARRMVGACRSSGGGVLASVVDGTARLGWCKRFEWRLAAGYAKGVGRAVQSEPDEGMV